VKELVYGDALGSFVYMTRQRAEDLEQVNKAVRLGGTWGEFRKRVPPRIAKELVRTFGRIRNGEPFDELPGDGDWPFPHHAQIELLPNDVVELGTIVPTVINDERLEFPYAAEGQIRKRLRAHGYKVVKNNRLIRAACDDGTDYTYFKSH
jgi:hypothetical protein